MYQGIFNFSKAQRQYDVNTIRDKEEMYYYDKEESFAEVKEKFGKVCRELSYNALRETAAENISLTSPVYAACQEEMNRRTDLEYRKMMREELHHLTNKTKRKNRRIKHLQIKELGG